MEKVYKENYFEWMSRISKQSNWEITCWVVFLGVLIGAPWGGVLICYKFFAAVAAFLKKDVSFFQNVIDLALPSCVAWYILYAVYYAAPRARIGLTYVTCLVFIVYIVRSWIISLYFINENTKFIEFYYPVNDYQFLGSALSIIVSLYAVFKINNRFALMMASAPVLQDAEA